MRSRSPSLRAPSALFDGRGTVAWSFGVCLLALGCQGRGVHAELFELETLGPSEVEAGRRIVIEGSGLPHGSSATLVLEGTLSEPGETSALSLEIPAEIASTEHAEALVTGALLDRVGHHGRGTFRGRAELLVPMADGSGTVSGSIEDVVLDLLPSRGLGLEPGLEPMDELDAAFEDLDEPLAMHAGGDLADVLGVTLTLTHAAGATVATVQSEGPAARLGLLPGDGIRAIDGLRILVPGDLSGWEGARIESLEVQRGEVVRTLHPPTTADASPDDRARAMQLAALMFVLFGLLRERERAVPEKLRPLLSRARLDWARGAVALGIPVLALLLAHQVLVHAGVDRLQMLLAPAFGFVVIAGSVIDRSPLAVLFSFGRAVLVLCVVASAVMTTGSAELLELEGGQTWMPFTWALLGTPVAPALLVSLAMALPIPDRSARVAVHLLGLVAELVVVVLVVVCLMGGRGDAGPLGALAFAVRGLLLLVTLRVLREALVASMLRTRVIALTGSLAAMAALGAFVWMAHPSPQLSMSLARASGELWVVSIALGALFLFRPRPAPLLETELSL